MTELLPTVQAARLRESLLDYLSTTFALADDDARAALTEFLGHPHHGLLKGPFVRLRLPFEPAADGWRESLDWHAGPPPYGHQAQAFARLSSARLTPERPRPEPTVVTTGTGSGKTEAFLLPILDHCRRAKQQGVRGLKALVLYPMNALANDQAQRLTSLLTSEPELAGITAALYTGQQGPQRTKVTVDGLITDRAVIRSDPPDILLTNYKMLDQLLLRADDARLWSQSARSLQYLVLDEFHTYDGAQGTDVSMLLRRLGLALKAAWRDEDPSIPDADRARPLGQVTPVATSATLGDKGDPQAMLEFAETVFGEPFPPDSVITETRQTPERWIGDAPQRVAAGGYRPADLTALLARDLADAVRALPSSADGRQLTDTVLAALWSTSSQRLAGLTDEERLDLLKAHPVTPVLLNATADAVAVADLVRLLAGGTPVPAGDEDAAERRWTQAVSALLAAFSAVRATTGRQAASVDLHLWVRELTRVDRAASSRPEYLWSDDGDASATPSEATAEQSGPPLPAVYCRHCGRSGWAVALAPTGLDLDTDDATVRRRRMARDDRYRPLLHAPAEGDRVLGGSPGEPVHVEGLLWLAVQERRLLTQIAADDPQLRAGALLPVLTHLGDEAGKASLDDTCPACGGKDGIRFLGSAIATLLSVSLSTLFGDAALDAREKKALVFTDSVQDAAHRAGFVQSRSYGLTLRSVLREAVGDTAVALDALVDQAVLDAGDDPHRRYRIVPPDLVDRPEFAPFWQRERLRDVPAAVRARVKRRLLLDATLEFGLQSRTGRTLERTGSIAVEVSVAPTDLAAAGRAALDEAGGLPTLPGEEPLAEQQLTVWARGVLERMRERGAIEHEWFRRYQQEDGRRYSIWGGRNRSAGMPAFPAGRSAPGYPRIGGAAPGRNTDLDPVTSSQSWYALWAAKVLQVSPADGARLARLLLQRLDVLGLVDSVTSESGAQVYQVAASRIRVHPVALADLRAGKHLLTCTLCQSQLPGTTEVVDQLDGAPCLVARCAGTLARRGREDNFYRRMYAATELRRVVAREHTGLLADEERLRYETQFKAAQTDPSAPNVLVATPTLEMGIDIGDLSTVLLAGLPRSVASYLQRVGRAGRLTGNAFDIAFVTGRGEGLPRLGDPLLVINGEVRPPATYLDAEEILRRQYLASLADRLARDPQAPHPRRATEAIGSTDPGSYLHALLTDAEQHTQQRLDAFLSGFRTLTPEAEQRLRRWATPEPDQPGSSGLAQRLVTECHRWRHTVETLELRRQQIINALPELEKIAAGPAATDDDKRAWRTAKASHKLTGAQLAGLRGDYWIGVLEEHGLLPNYTLVDDSVTLDVSLSWTDPDSGEFQTDAFSYRRGGAQALRDFAPGATFYAGGHALRVDAIDLGRSGDAIRAWVLCPACGYAAGPDPGPVVTCPRCGAAGIADMSQKLEVVELVRVYSAMRRDDADITDDRDERSREQYTLVTAADVDSAGLTRQWYVEGYDFGAKHLRDMTIRWLNLGRAGGQGTPRILAGSDVNASLFRLCAACGQLDTATGRNSAAEHRPWCPHRKASTEQTRNLALSRTLITEGLVLRLPTSVTLGDLFAVPSLSAAVLLGLRERIGGAPDHIEVVTIKDPSGTPGEDNRDALLLHDVVPGGTGYLADLARPEPVWALLHAAWRVVKDCACREEPRMACHRCLLPFAAPHQVQHVSRAAAERHLREILTAGTGKDEPPDALSWTCTETEPSGFDPESTLEQQFRAVLAERLRALGAAVKETPTAKGNRWVITLGGSGRIWTLEPQEMLHGCKPDFLLRCNDPSVPDTAIFTDGWRYHASPAINRLTDDAAKRAVLRDAGLLVLAVTWLDLEQARDGAVPPPPWYRASDVPAVLEQTGGRLSPASVALLSGGPIDLLLSWLQDPRPQDREALADVLPMFLVSSAARQGVIGAADAVQAARAALDGTLSDTGSPGWTWTSDTVALVTDYDDGSGAMAVTLVLDDRTERLGELHRPAWQEWLRLSNLLSLRLQAISVTSWSGLSSTSPAKSAAAPELPVGWRELWENGTALERALIEALAAAGVDPLPVQGQETAEGISLGLSWPHLGIVVDLDLSDEDRADLTDEWTLIRPNADDVLAALTSRRS
jgi:ATP-dependent helicase YprA (DUF1998 family)